MRCLCCGKEITSTNSQQANKLGWHENCLKRFFRVGSVPEIDIRLSKIEALGKQNISTVGSVQGVQRKLSLGISNDGYQRITVVNYPVGFILKPPVEEYENLPEYEHLTMQMAKAVGIKTVPNALIRLDDKISYITRRIDRFDEEGNSTRLAMEDFCQLEERLTEDKYKSSYERCVKIIKKHSSRQAFDLTEILLRIIFFFVTGNSDMHLKNFSLIQINQNKEKYQLSPAYDMLPVKLVMPEDIEELALTLNGKKSKIDVEDFKVLADKCSVNSNIVFKMIKRIDDKKNKLFELCEDSLLPFEKKEEYKELIANRLDRLKN